MTRNGETVVHDGTHIITDTQQGDQLQSNLQINSFTDSDAGVYQCIYTDSDSDAEVATSLPLRLDYGALVESYIVSKQTLHTNLLKVYSYSKCLVCPLKRL